MATANSAATLKLNLRKVQFIISRQSGFKTKGLKRGVWTHHGCKKAVPFRDYLRKEGRRTRRKGRAKRKLPGLSKLGWSGLRWNFARGRFKSRQFGKHGQRERDGDDRRFPG